MAYDNPGHGGGESFYDDAPPAKEKEESGSNEDGQKTYVLPKAVLEGKEFEPGDELVLRIVSMHEDQIEVTYAPAKEQEKGEGQGEGQMAEAPAGGGEGGGGAGYSSMME
jgi:hypothetical protein